MVLNPTADIFPPPRPATFGPRKGSEGVSWHTTEATATTRAAAVGTATWQRTHPGSYGWIIYDPASPGTPPGGGALLTVPYLEASGGMNPGTAGAPSPYWRPERFPWLKQLLSPAAYADPNAHLLNIAFSGRTADLVAGLAARRGDVLRMVTVAAELALWIERQPWGADNLVFTGHLHWQTNRSDPGQPIIDAILTRMQELVRPAPPPPIVTPPPDYKALYGAELLKVQDLTGKLTTARARIVLKDAHQSKYPTG